MLSRGCERCDQQSHAPTSDQGRLRSIVVALGGGVPGRREEGSGKTGRVGEVHFITEQGLLEGG